MLGPSSRVTRIEDRASAGGSEGFKSFGGDRNGRIGVGDKFASTYAARAGRTRASDTRACDQNIRKLSLESDQAAVQKFLTEHAPRGLGRWGEARKSACKNL